MEVEEMGEKEAVVVEAAPAAKEVAGGDTITLISSDGKPFEVSKEAAGRLSNKLKVFVKTKKISGGGCTVTDAGIQLEKVGSKALEKVVDYFNKHADDSDPADGSRSVGSAASSDLRKWDRELVDSLSKDDLLDLVEAAEVVAVDGLLDITCRKLADMIKGKPLVQIREMFNIKNDYTPEEEKQIRREHAWAFGDYTPDPEEE